MMIMITETFEMMTLMNKENTNEPEKDTILKSN